jgi:hypothetical protein
VALTVSSRAWLHLKGLLVTCKNPFTFPPLALKQSQEVFNARVLAYAAGNGRPSYLPLEAHDFHRTYLIVHRSLRNALAYANDYCLHVAESGPEPKESDEKMARYDAWLKKMALSVRDAVKNQTGPRALKLFTDAIDSFQGEFSPGDFEVLGFKSVQAMRPQVRALEEVGLLEAQKDDVDQRRKSIAVTGKGWLVHWCLVTHGS